MQERTKTFEIQNQALELSRAILEDLLFPVIGISAEGMIAKVRKMKKIKIVSPISTKNSDSIELITMSLQNLDHDLYFFLDINELFNMDKKDLDIILLEPDMNSWQ